MPRPAAPLDPALAARLREAAAREFAALGFEHASLNRIVASAGISKSSVYHHIGGKQALLDELLAALSSAVEEALRELDPARLTAATFWDAATAALGDLARVAEQHPELHAIGPFVHGPDGADTIAGLRAAGVARVRDYLERGQQLGAVRSDIPADLLAEIALATLLAIDAWALANGSENTVHASLTMLRSSLEAA